jgi:hypothetical protein
MTHERLRDKDRRRGESPANRTARILGAIVIALLLIAIILLATGVVKMSPLTGP